jgi:hypothetical protein
MLTLSQRVLGIFQAIAARCAKVVTLSVSVLLLPCVAFALRIDNPKIDMQLSQGESYSGQIVVENNDTHEIRVKVYAEDFLYKEPFDGEKQFLPKGTTPLSLASWLTMSPLEFSLAPYGRQTVNFVLRPGENVDRVHCGIIFFETALGKAISAQGEGIDILGRVGTLIFIEPPKQEKKGEFGQIKENENSFEGIFKNAGNTFLHVQGIYYIIDSNAKVKARGKTNELYLLPENQTKVSVKPQETLSAGNYTVVLTFDLEGGKVLVKEIDFSVTASGTYKIVTVRD